VSQILPTIDSLLPPELTTRVIYQYCFCWAISVFVFSLLFLIFLFMVQ